METEVVLPLISQGRYKNTESKYWSRIEPDLLELLSDKRFCALINRVTDNLGNILQQYYESDPEC